MKHFWILALMVVGLGFDFASIVDTKLIMTQVVTRHGDRAPDKIVGEQSCTVAWKGKKEIFKAFHALPGRLTPSGVQKMRDVGSFLRERYIEGYHWDEKFENVPSSGLLNPVYQDAAQDWQFIARWGFRQQRSMMGVTLGMFPNEPVPIEVSKRLEDAELGGPAPSCCDKTAEMIVDWHKIQGWEYLQKHWKQVVEPIQEKCHVNLTGNPVNAIPGGGNPHAWIGDISDASDAAKASGLALPGGITPELHEKLTEVAYYMEQGSHYDDPKGAIYFAGEFPNHVIKAFEAWGDGSKRPKKMPRMRLHLCSRELLYGLEHMFGWEKLQLKDQPAGRIIAGSSFIWELHDKHDDGKELFVRFLHWTPGMPYPKRLQEDKTVKEFRAQYEEYIRNTGGKYWHQLCDFKHFNTKFGTHDPEFLNPLYKPATGVVLDTLNQHYDSDAAAEIEPEAKPEINRAVLPSVDLMISDAASSDGGVVPGTGASWVSFVLVGMLALLLVLAAFPKVRLQVRRQLEHYQNGSYNSIA